MGAVLIDLSRNKQIEVMFIDDACSLNEPGPVGRVRVLTSKRVKPCPKLRVNPNWLIKEESHAVYSESPPVLFGMLDTRDGADLGARSYSSFGYNTLTAFIETNSITFLES